MSVRHNRSALTPEALLDAYRLGFFPMAEGRNGPLAWYSPDPRGIIPLAPPSIPRSLRRELRNAPFEIRVDTSFAAVMRGCADREDTWISGEIVDLYCALHERGYGHSVESWRDGVLAGGLYGVALGGAFFGESMFSRVPGASKAALAALMDHLAGRGFSLLDTQFITSHLAQFGAIEVPREQYLRMLENALDSAVSFL